MNDISYFNFVEETLTEQWDKYKQPLRINSNDLTAATVLLTKIAVEAVNKECSIKEDKSVAKSHKVSLETEPPTQVEDKIKAFVKKNADAFRSACQTGFPFSLLENASTEAALRHALENDGSILSHFMTLEDVWMDENELNERFGNLFQNLQASEIAEDCLNLKQAYVKEGDNKAGYYLLWLIKHAAGCSYKIPEKGSFNSSTVAEVLSEFFAESGSMANAANFLEILHYRSSRLNSFLFQGFLDPKSCSIFLGFAVEQLQNIPMNNWPCKANIIADLLETVTSEEIKLLIATTLASSKDLTTSKVGEHLTAALKALSFKEMIPHFNALDELLPNFNHHVEYIFGRPFVKFCEGKSIYPEFTKCLHFNDIRKVFVHDSLMIGVYRGLPPHLLAYDINTEKMVWGIPLTPVPLEDPSSTPMTFATPRRRPASSRMEPSYILEKVGDYISLQFVGEKKMYFIHPETGEFNSTLELPEISQEFHISPKGFAYQMDQNRILNGGKIIDKQWISSFKSKAPNGLFRSFSTHCGFQQDYNDKLVLVGPTGDQVIIQDYMAAKAHNDKLYSIEKDPRHEDKSLLRIRTLKIDNEVISSVEKSISINAQKVTIGDFCQNGQIVLLARNSDISPIFVDLESQEVIYSQHKFPNHAASIINAESGELWTLDYISHKLWKVSSTNITLMGSLESSRGTALLHVDKRNNLYFMDIPF